MTTGNGQLCNCSHCHGGGLLPGVKEQPGSNPKHKPDIFRLYGLDCADCAAKLEKRLLGIAGVEKAKVNFATAKLSVWHSGSNNTIVQAVEQTGYRAVPEGVGPDQGRPETKEQSYKNSLTAASGLFLVAGLLFMFLGWGEKIATAFFLLAIVTGGFYVAKNTFHSIRFLDIDMNVLLTVAVLGAMAIGQWAEGATAVFLFSLGNTLQAMSVDKTRNSIKSLMEFAPRTALIKKNDGEVEIPVEAINIDDVIIVKPGTRIAMDGRVLSGVSMVNQAPITGESLPVEKSPGSEVFAGTFNEQGALEVKVTRLVQDNTLSRIINMVEEAQGRRAPSQQFVDVFAKYYTPAVMALALIIAVLPPLLWGQPFIAWLEKGLIMLVIACPCALVISTPVAIVSAIGSAAKKGVLIKGGAYLEKISSIKAMAFDKTGTLTHGTPLVTDVIPLNGYTDQELLALAAALESRSQHVLARAIVEKAKTVGATKLESSNFQAIMGQGASAVIDGATYYIGSPGLFQKFPLNLGGVANIIRGLQAKGKTVVIVATASKLLGLIALSDRPRSSSAAMLSGLRAAGIGKTIMLTGDNEGTAGAIAADLGIHDFKAGLLPGDKLQAIRDLQDRYGQVAMVGDGVNDAPALATADIGIAMGGIGTDVALDTADMVLVADNLSKLPYAITLSRRTLGIIKQNIVFALLIKAVFMAGTFVGLTNLWMAVLADTGASLLVIANGMRLMLVRDDLIPSQDYKEHDLCLDKV